MTERVEALKSMLAEDPNNTFVRYGLAMAHATAGDLEPAIEAFRALIEINPNYCAAYYHAGQTFERMGRIDDAKGMYERGIDATRRVNDLHTQSELQAALDLLPI